MSRRAAAPNLRAVEEDLPPEARAFLDWYRARFGLGPHWTSVKALEEVLTTAALEEKARELEDAGESATRARIRAGARQGVSADTVRTRLQRWYRATRKPRVSLNMENGRRGGTVDP